MDEFEKRLRKIEKFDAELKKFNEEKLLAIRQDENNHVFDSKKKIDLIDREFSRRKPFYSAFDKMVDESVRSSNTNMCAFYDCDKPSVYYSQIGVENEIYGLFACRKHTGTLYEPTHRIHGNVDVVKLRKETE